MWFVDSSKFIDWMRRGESPIRILRPFLVAGQLRTCGIVPVEVLRGVVKPAVRDEMAALFDAIPEVPLSPDIWKRTADLASDSVPFPQTANSYCPAPRFRVLQAPRV